MDNNVTNPFYKAIVGPAVYEYKAPYRLVNKQLNSVDVDIFLKSVPKGRVMEKDVEANIKHQIFSSFVDNSNRLLATRYKEVEYEIVANVRKLVAKNESLSSARHDLYEALASVRFFVNKHLCFVSDPMFDKPELRGLHDEAEQLLLKGEGAKGNDMVVVEYYHALVAHCVWTCRNMVRRYAGRFLLRMVEALSQEFDLEVYVVGACNRQPPLSLPVGVPKELHSLVEPMAENVHRVWMKTRLGQGWAYGLERTDAKKEHPGFVPYDQLSEEEKELDRNTSIETLRFVVTHGFRIEKDESSNADQGNQ